MLWLAGMMAALGVGSAIMKISDPGESDDADDWDDAGDNMLPPSEDMLITIYEGDGFAPPDADAFNDDPDDDEEDEVWLSDTDKDDDVYFASDDEDDVWPDMAPDSAPDIAPAIALDDTQDMAPHSPEKAAQTGFDPETEAAMFDAEDALLERLETGVTDGATAPGATALAPQTPDLDGLDPGKAAPEFNPATQAELAAHPAQDNLPDFVTASAESDAGPDLFEPDTQATPETDADDAELPAELADPTSEIGLEDAAENAAEDDDEDTAAARTDDVSSPAAASPAEDGRQRAGGHGAQAMEGGSGDDSLSGENGEDTLTGQDGADWLDGGRGADLIFGAGSDFAGPLEDDSADTLAGGQGDDTLVAGAGDTVSTGKGDDLVVIGDWVTGDAPAHIPDFNAKGEDRMVLVWDDAAGPAPPVELAPDPEDDGMRNVVMGDMIVAQVPVAAGLTADAIDVVPLSTAQAVGWTGL